jgi:hypothetical protein
VEQLDTDCPATKESQSQHSHSNSQDGASIAQSQRWHISSSTEQLNTDYATA